MKSNTSPLEDAEQTTFVRWLEDNDLKFTAVPNSTYTKFESQKRKNHRVGLRAGFPDMIVLIPPTKSIDGEGYFLNIEMKRLIGSSTSQEQKDWNAAINELNLANTVAYICKGSESAKNVVRHYLKDPVDNVF